MGIRRRGQAEESGAPGQQCRGHSHLPAAALEHVPVSVKFPELKISKTICPVNKSHLCFSVWVLPIPHQPCTPPNVQDPRSASGACHDGTTPVIPVPVVAGVQGQGEAKLGYENCFNRTNDDLKNNKLPRLSPHCPSSIQKNAVSLSPFQSRRPQGHLC